MRVSVFVGPGWSIEERQKALEHSDGRGYDWILAYDDFIPLLPAFYHATQEGWKGCVCAVSLDRLLDRIDEAVMNFEATGEWSILVTPVEGKHAQVFPRKGAHRWVRAT